MARSRAGTRVLFAAARFGPLAMPVAAKPVRIAYVCSDGNISGTLKAYKALLEERPDLCGQVTLTFLTESLFDEVKPAELTGADVLVLDIMNQQMLRSSRHRLSRREAIDGCRGFLVQASRRRTLRNSTKYSRLQRFARR